jgi:hypothetical protein
MHDDGRRSHEPKNKLIVAQWLQRLLLEYIMMVKVTTQLLHDSGIGVHVSHFRVKCLGYWGST